MIIDAFLFHGRVEIFLLLVSKTWYLYFSLQEKSQSIFMESIIVFLKQRFILCTKSKNVFCCLRYVKSMFKIFCVCVCVNLLKPTGDGVDLFQTYDMIW